METQGKVEVWMSGENKFKTTGKPDTYVLLGEVEVSSGEYRIQKNQVSGDLMKLVLKGEHNVLSIWKED